MTKLPDLIFVVDAKYENIAVEEARKVDIPIAALVDTNSNPENIDVVIPGNDDAIRAISLFIGYMADAVKKGLALLPGHEIEAEENNLAESKSPELPDEDVSSRDPQEELPKEATTEEPNKNEELKSEELKNEELNENPTENVEKDSPENKEENDKDIEENKGEKEEEIRG
jgi:small subunit ribosomal protein S2